jgi:hypothetical protein
MSSPPLQIYYSPDGFVDPDTGLRSPLWSASDAHSPARTLKHMTEVLLETGWSLSTLVKLPNADEPETLLALYKAQHEGKLPRNFDRHQREAKIQKHMQDNAGGQYGTAMPASKYGRSDYGGNLP